MMTLAKYMFESNNQIVIVSDNVSNSRSLIKSAHNCMNELPTVNNGTVGATSQLIGMDIRPSATMELARSVKLSNMTIVTIKSIKHAYVQYHVDLIICHNLDITAIDTLHAKFAPLPNYTKMHNINTYNMDK